nr:hypothetical protein [Tanacetum cinerariifolium]
MDSQSTPVISAAKLPILNPNEFDLWKMRIKQYSLMTYYLLWEVIINGDSPAPTVIIKGAVRPATILSADQKLARRNELKARGNPTQNLAFVSSSNTDNTTDSVSAATSVSDVCAQLPMAMLTMRARRFLQKTGRNLGDNRVTTMGFDMSKVKCYNCHKKEHFAQECRSPKDTRKTGAAEPQRRHVPSYQVEEEPANFAIMAIPSSSSASDNEVQSCSKSCSKAYDQLHSQYDKLTVEYRKYQIDILSYQAGLESVEARLVMYKKNESILQENINMLKNEVEARDNVLSTLKQKLNQAEKERDALKLKFDKFQTSSKSFIELLANQTNNKHGLGYYSESDSKSLSPSSLSDRIQPSGEYHDVPPPITGNFMPPKLDLVFHAAPIAVETAHSAFTVQLSPTKPAKDLSHTARPMAPIIEDWVSNTEDESEPNDPHNVPSFVQPTEHVKPFGYSDQPVEPPILAATPKPASPKTNCSSKRKNRKTWVEKGCSRVETPLFEGMLVVREPEEQGDAEEQGNDDNAAEEPVTAVSEDDVEDQSIPSPTPPTSPPQQLQDISSTSQSQSPPPQPQSLTPAQPQGADFPMSLLQEALDACAALAR